MEYKKNQIYKNFPSPQKGINDKLPQDVSSIILQKIENLDNICFVNKQFYKIFRSIQKEESHRRIISNSIKRTMLRHLIEATLFSSCGSFYQPVFRRFDPIMWSVYDESGEEWVEAEDYDTNYDDFDDDIWVETEFC